MRSVYAAIGEALKRGKPVLKCEITGNHTETGYIVADRSEIPEIAYAKSHASGVDVTIEVLEEVDLSSAQVITGYPVQLDSNQNPQFREFDQDDATFVLLNETEVERFEMLYDLSKKELDVRKDIMSDEMYAQKIEELMSGKTIYTFNRFAERNWSGHGSGGNQKAHYGDGFGLAYYVTWHAIFSPRRTTTIITL